MSLTALRILITVPSPRYQFQYNVLQSFIYDVQAQDDAFKAIKLEIQEQILDHNHVFSHTQHTRAMENFNAFILISISEGTKMTCNRRNIQLPPIFDRTIFRRCIKQYFSAFLEQTATNNANIRSDTNGFVIRQQKFQPFIEIQQSDQFHVNGNDNSAQLRSKQETISMQMHEQTTTNSNQWETGLSFEEILTEISEGTYSPIHSRQLMHSEISHPNNDNEFSPFFLHYVFICLACLLLLRLYLFKSRW
mmetsp:Transcript_11472/g.17391  ORF Transcript_11472/g.17391 Transcript_11472/m.17391 type:complete len:249 (+) Transcript_11472:23-769(+)